MTLNEFISHQKHNSVNIRIQEDDMTLKFVGDVGEYRHWIGKEQYGNYQINVIYFNGIDEMIIQLEEE